MSSVIKREVTTMHVLASREGVRLETANQHVWFNFDATTARGLAAELLAAADNVERMQQATEVKP